MGSRQLQDLTGTVNNFDVCDLNGIPVNFTDLTGGAENCVPRDVCDLNGIPVNFTDLTGGAENCVPRGSDAEFRPQPNAPVRYNRNRNERSPTFNPVRRMCETNPNILQTVMSTFCCTSACTSKMSLQKLQFCREKFWSIGTEQQRRFINNAFKYALLDNKTSVFVVEGVQTCAMAWKLAYGVKDRRYHSLKQQFLEKKTIHSLPFLATKSQRYLEAMTWLSDFSKKLSERQPDKEELHLPSSFTKKMIYEEYKDETETPLSQTSFMAMWNTEFSNVKISKEKEGTCGECTTIVECIRESQSKEEVGEIHSIRKEHLELQAICRQKYYKHIKKAVEQPKKYISVIIDNMDQKKTALPRLHQVSKVDTAFYRMHHHVTGVKSHGTSTDYVYTWTDLFHPDCNVMINCLNDVVLDVQKQNEANMPGTLYIQADNSGKDNKNKFVMCYLASLVKAGIFKKVKYSFLMVGHTHEDVDQLFSRISVALKNKSTVTLPQLEEEMRGALKKPPIVKHLDAMWDFKDVLANSHKLEGVSGPHAFVFKSEGDDIFMYCKDWPNSEQQTKVNVTQFCVNLDHFTEFQTVSSNPKGLTLIDTMKTTIPKWGQAGRLKTEDVRWWMSYLNNIENKQNGIPTTPLPSQLVKFQEMATIVRETSGPLSALREKVSKNKSKRKVSLKRCSK